LKRVAAGSYQYIANLNYIGPDLVIYQLCSTDPNCECSTATVRLTIGGEIEDCMEIPSIITPNGDDKNEAFSIPCLSQIGKYPNNELIIFNQWGDEVFRQKPYGNSWAGTFDGEELPDGTYFYVLDLGNGDKPLSGFLIVQR
jgi:gliding motility-associated-like protein